MTVLLVLSLHPHRIHAGTNSEKSDAGAGGGSEGNRSRQGSFLFNNLGGDDEDDDLFYLQIYLHNSYQVIVGIM